MRFAIALAVSAVLVGVVIASGVFDDGQRPPVAAARNAPKIIVAARDGVQVRSTIDGRVIRTLIPPSTTDNYTGVAGAPDGSAVYVTRVPHETSCVHGALPELVRIDLATGRQQSLVQGSSPLIRSDGRWIASSIEDGCAPSPNYLLSKASAGEAAVRASKTPPRTTAASYLPDGRLVVGVSSDRGYEIEMVDENGTVIEQLFEEPRVTPGMVALGISIDAEGRVLVLDNEGRVLIWQHGDRGARVVMKGAQDVAWLPDQIDAESRQRVGG